MKHITKLKLTVVQQHCDVEDKSTEYMLQLMQDTCNVELDTCISFMSLDDKEHRKLIQELNSFFELIIKLEPLLVDNGE